MGHNIYTRVFTKLNYETQVMCTKSIEPIVGINFATNHHIRAVEFSGVYQNEVSSTIR